MDSLEFYKEIYYKEQSRRSDIQNTLNIPIAIISAFLTAIFFLMTSYQYGVENFLDYFFCSLCSISIITMIFSIYYLVRAFGVLKGYEYSGIPYPDSLLCWEKDLEKYYKDADDPDLANKEFEKFVLGSFARCAEQNMYVNDKKAKDIYLSKKYLIITMVVMFFTMIPYSYNFVKKDETIGVKTNWPNSFPYKKELLRNEVV